MTLAYVYQAELLCDGCAARIVETQLKGREPSEDSDSWPQGPYANGGGESDSPQHCGGCGEFLGNPLTPEGAAYVRKESEPYGAPDSTWEEIARRAEADGKATLAEWIRFYFAEGQ